MDADLPPPFATICLLVGSPGLVVLSRCPFLTSICLCLVVFCISNVDLHHAASIALFRFPYCLSISFHFPSGISVSTHLSDTLHTYVLNTNRGVQLDPSSRQLDSDLNSEIKLELYSIHDIDFDKVPSKAVGKCLARGGGDNKVTRSTMSVNCNIILTFRIYVGCCRTKVQAEPRGTGLRSDEGT